MEFFTADHHFGHWSSEDRNIIKYCNRPFGTIDEMDNALVQQWNGAVKQNDIVYHLGDFTLGDTDTAWQYFRRLNGCIHVLGNWWHHDRRWLPREIGQSRYTTKSNHAVWIIDPVEVLDQGSVVWPSVRVPVVLSHYPYARWDRMHHGAWHLHAHCHGLYQFQGKILDVGVDNAYGILGEYRPFSVDEIVEHMAGREVYSGI